MVTWIISIKILFKNEIPLQTKCQNQLTQNYCSGNYRPFQLIVDTFQWELMLSLVILFQQSNQTTNRIKLIVFGSKIRTQTCLHNSSTHTEHICPKIEIIRFLITQRVMLLNSSTPSVNFFSKKLENNSTKRNPRLCKTAWIYSTPSPGRDPKREDALPQIPAHSQPNLQYSKKPLCPLFSTAEEEKGAPGENLTAKLATG